MAHPQDCEKTELPRFLRLPRPGQRDPVFGFTRSFLNSLILPNRQNDFKPPVKSYVIRRRGARTGVRLIDGESLLKFVLAHEADAEIEAKGGVDD